MAVSPNMVSIRVVATTISSSKYEILSYLVSKLFSLSPYPILPHDMQMTQALQTQPCLRSLVHVRRYDQSAPVCQPKEEEEEEEEEEEKEEEKEGEDEEIGKE